MTKPDNKQYLLIAGGIFILTLLCFGAYGDILGFYFTSIDSFPLILSGRIDSVLHVGKIFSSPLGGGFPFGSYYRPISELTYGIDSLIWGKNPFGYHLTDILLHLLNSILVFMAANILFRNFRRRLLAAWIASALFLLSPINMSVITTMERRQDVVMAMMFSLSLLAFGKAQKTENIRIDWYLYSLLFGCLAVFSKESAFVLPVVVWFLAFIFNDSRDYIKRAIRATKYTIPFFGFVLLNTALHLYFFGQWDVRTSSGLHQNAIALINSFFIFAGPLEVLRLPLIGKALIVLTLSFISSVSLMRMLFKTGLNGFFDFVLHYDRRAYTFLLVFIFTFMALFTAKGMSHDFYHYLPNMALTALIAMLLFDTQRGRLTKIIMKAIGALFAVYIIIFSPVFNDYKAWRSSSNITRQVIKETENFLLSDRDAARVYLINWPGFIGDESDFSGANSTILVSYSMNAWAEWSGLKSTRDLEFIHVSYTSFPSGDIHAKLDYTFTTKGINMNVNGCQISPSKVPYKGQLPFKIQLNEDKKEGRLIFNRELLDDERLFLYDTKGLKIVDKNTISLQNETGKE